MRKLALIIPSLLAVGAGAYYFRVLGSEIAIFDKYPNEDPNLLIKVHREIIKETLTGKYQHVDLNDEAIEKIFEWKLNARKNNPGLFR